MCINSDGNVSLIDHDDNMEHKSKDEGVDIGLGFSEGYIAPEIRREYIFYMNSATWSIGVSMYNLLSRCRRIRDCRECLLDKNYSNNLDIGAKYPSCVDNLKCSLELKTIIAKLLIIDHQKRPTSEQALALLGPKPKIEQMNMLDLTLTKSKLEPIIANLQNLLTDATRIKQQQTTVEDIEYRLNLANKQLDLVCKHIEIKENLGSLEPLPINL